MTFRIDSESCVVLLSPHLSTNDDVKPDPYMNKDTRARRVDENDKLIGSNAILIWIFEHFQLVRDAAFLLRVDEISWLDRYIVCGVFIRHYLWISMKHISPPLRARLTSFLLDGQECDIYLYEISIWRPWPTNLLIALSRAGPLEHTELSFVYQIELYAISSDALLSLSPRKTLFFSVEKFEFQIFQAPAAEFEFLSFDSVNDHRIVVKLTQKYRTAESELNWKFTFSFSLTLRRRLHPGVGQLIN